jgi:hypothetical protein
MVDRWLWKRVFVFRNEGDRIRNLIISCAPLKKFYAEKLVGRKTILLLNWNETSINGQFWNDRVSPSDGGEISICMLVE